MLAFRMILIAYLFQYKNIVISSEKSADFGNIEWKGKIINHQYTKSKEFEKQFINYVERYVIK